MTSLYAHQVTVKMVLHIHKLYKPARIREKATLVFLETEKQIDEW